MYTVTEAAQLVGVSSGTLRLWEAQGLVQPQRGPGGRRRYSEADLERLRKIQWWRRVRGLNAPAIRRELEREEYERLGDAQPTPPARPGQDLQLRTSRRRAGLTLKQLSERSGLSVSFLSAVERGVSAPSPTAAARLTAALHGDVRVDAQQESPVHRLGSGKRVDIAPGITYEWLSGHQGLLEPQLAVVQPGAHSDNTYQHDGEEFLVVLSGSFELTLGEAVRVLTPRDSVHFDSQVPHSWANRGDVEAEVLWITTERGVWQAGSSSHAPRKD
ncbi:MerR family transcriptional regulator [Jiangella sp. DSM 45060]|uniref:MerR family transcriptional regulator n=1 Tax=Jiangella sp. DSM 45060 TaxID=1798224 RepID=UPI00087AB24D|nr:MerR family transcriptional regulator [Jiangella sp. DSM 45060]SDS53136.1 DNA-binding transcriptional regulator, MerR family [Jiangella sp. DSM 45060]